MIFPKNFTNLHGHSSQGSILDAIGESSEIFDFVLENGMNSCALSEHANMASYVSAYLYQKKLKQKGINFKYLPACEFYFYPDLNEWKRDLVKHEENKLNAKKEKKEKQDDEITATVENEEETKSGKYFNPLKRRHHLVVLAKTSRGLKNLFTLVSKGYKNGFYYFPRIDFNWLKEYGEDLIVSSACLGTIFGHPIFSRFQNLSIDELIPDLLEKDLSTKSQILNDAENLVDRFVDAVGKENFFLEIQFNKIPAQHLLNKVLIETSKKTGINLVATADFHYYNNKGNIWQSRELYKKLGWLNYQNLEFGQLPQSIDELKAELYPKNAEQMWSSYKQTTENYDFYNDQIVCDAIERTYSIAHDLIGEVEPDRSVKLPSFVVPENTTAFNELVRLCKIGMKKRGLEHKKEYIERLKEELELIKEKNFEKYFLTTKEIVDIARERTLVNFGRGSCAGSLVCYVLKITGINPLKYNLLFSRFLNKFKVNWPDADLDFSDRSKVISGLKEKFGDENVLYITNFTLFKLKSLIKDISKFYNIPFEEVNLYIKNVDKDVREGSQKETGEKILEPTLEDAKKYSQSFREFIEKYPQIAEHIEILFKQARGIGTHAGGIILGENLENQLPIIRSKGKLQTPWSESGNITHLEEMGWLKFDILGIETLEVVERCISLILQRHFGFKNPTFQEIRKWFEENLDPNILDLEDEKVYENVWWDQKFAGIFQFTEPAVQKFVQKVKPKNITDLSVCTSIFRPGSLMSGMDKVYLKNRNVDEIKYEHPVLKEILEESNNVYCFQEQIMLLANKLGKIPEHECDILRKVISKKPEPGSESEKKAFALESKFIKGSTENGLSTPRSKEIFDDFKKFSKYSFNKCLYKNTQVETIEGIRKIKNVKIGDYVNSKNGFIRVNDVIFNGKKKLYKIKTKSGRVLICSIEHKLETEEGMVSLEEIIRRKLKIVIK